MQVQVARWGNSLGIRIPREIAGRAGPITGEILTSHVRSIDMEARPVVFVGSAVPGAILADVRAKLAVLIELEL